MESPLDYVCTIKIIADSHIFETWYSHIILHGLSASIPYIRSFSFTLTLLLALLLSTHWTPLRRVSCNFENSIYFCMVQEACIEKKICQKLSKLWTIYAFQNKTQSAKVWWVFEPFNVCLNKSEINSLKNNHFKLSLNCTTANYKDVPIFTYLSIYFFFQNGPGQYYHSFG